MTKDWLSRWESGHIGWHQFGGSAALRKFWPGAGCGQRVLVPLCGKSPDLRRVGDRADTKNSPPKFREAGIKEVVEAVWVS